MRKLNLTTALFAGLLIALSPLALNVCQALSDSPTAAAVKKLSRQEWERARNYFTDTQLLDQHGNKVRFYSDVLDGKVVVINVMYTGCKGSCPITTKMLTSVRASVGARFGKDIIFVSISNNPQQDTPQVMTEFARKQNAEGKGWHFLTGDKQNVDTIVKKLGFYSKDYQEHTALLVAGNTRTGHWIKIKPGTPMNGIVLQLTQLADEG